MRGGGGYYKTSHSAEGRGEGEATTKLRIVMRGGGGYYETSHSDEGRGRLLQNLA